MATLAEAMSVRGSLEVTRDKLAGQLAVTEASIRRLEQSMADALQAAGVGPNRTVRVAGRLTRWQHAGTVGPEGDKVLLVDPPLSSMDDVKVTLPSEGGVSVGK